MMYRFTRDSTSDSWKPLTPVWPTVIGANGLAWGYGLHPEPPAGEPRSIEGDDRSPAGVFRIFQQFGTARPESLSATALPFIELTDETECVDDPESRFYNRIVNRDLVKVDWDSSEKMAQSYQHGIDFSNNHEPILPSHGSCIFIHVWGGPEDPTRGCTVIAEDHLNELGKWLRADAKPLLVQLSKAKYEQFAKPWMLPPLSTAAAQNLMREP